MKMDVTANNTYQKNKGYAVDDGVKFQIGLSTVFMLNALRRLKDWRISTENENAGKFDDVVIETSDKNAVLLQAKQRKNHKVVTLNELVSRNPKNDDFSLPKYFLSYREIKNKFKVKSIVICTNSQIHENALKFATQKSARQSILQYDNGNNSFYAFTDKILPYLKEGIRGYYKLKNKKEINDEDYTDDKMNDFLNHLQFYSNYPSGDKLEQAIEGLLATLKDSNQFWNDISAQDVQNKVKAWYDQPKGEYLTDVRGKAMFCEIKTDKYCQKLERHNVYFERKNFIYTDPNRVFHIIYEGGHLLCTLKVYRTFHVTKGKVLFINPEDENVLKQAVEAFAIPGYTYLIIVNPKTTNESMTKEICSTLKMLLDKYEKKKIILVTDSDNKFSLGIPSIHEFCKVIKKPVRFEDLSEDTRDRLLKTRNICFQGNSVDLEELFPSREILTKIINSKVLEKLICDEKIGVGVPVLDLNVDTSRYYLSRTFTREVVKVEEADIYDVDEKVILISDSAGTGKTTVLTKLAVYIKNRHPNLWVIRIELNEYTRILRDLLRQNKVSINIMELLDSKDATKLSNNLEKFTFSVNNKVMLMLDGIDEISPDYTEIIMSLLSQCKEATNLAKVFVTSRPHMTPELEARLGIKSFTLKPFTEENQIQFLTSYWTHNLNLDASEHNRKKCVQFAKALVGKMLDWIKVKYTIKDHFTSIPLQVRMLAEIFQENFGASDGRDWQGCKEYLSKKQHEPKLPETINVTQLYDMFIEKKKNVFIDKGNPTGNSEANHALTDLFKKCLVRHRILALEVVLDKTKFELFSCHREQSNQDVEPNMLKIGIVQKSDNNELHFIHRTFAEYFLAESLVMELEQRSRNVDIQKFFIDEVLWCREFNVTRVFVDGFLRVVVDGLPCETFRRYQSLIFGDCWKLGKFNLLHRLASEDRVAILHLIFKCVDFKVIMNKETTCDDRSWIYTEMLRKRTVGNTLNVLQLLLRHGGVNIRDNIGRTPLHYGRLETVIFFVQCGANIHITDSFGRTALHFAASRSESDAVEYLVECGANIHTKEFNGCTALHNAAESGNLDSAKYLVDCGAAVDVTDGRGYTALHKATQGGFLDIVKCLVENGADVNVKDQKGCTALHYAAIRSPSTVKYLVEHGADIHVVDAMGQTALYRAAQDGCLDVIKYLVGRGADVHVKNKTGYTTLYRAALNFHCDSLKVLIGAWNEDITNRDGRMMLFEVAEANRLDIIKLLVERGVDVTVLNNRGCTALQEVIACAEKNQSQACILDTVKYLVECGVNVHVKDKTGRTVLHEAARLGHLNVIEYLIENGAHDFTNTDVYNKTALHEAARSGQLDIVRYFVERGADVHTKNRYKRTVLHEAARIGQLEVVRYLVELGVDIDAIDKYNKTALHEAAENGYLDVVEYLADHGADIHITTEKHGSALYHSAMCGQFHVANFLMARQDADTPLAIHDGGILLQLAASSGRLDIVRNLILDRGVDVNVRDSDNVTALHLAAGDGELEAVKLLVECGADVTIQNEDGLTALDVAVENDRLDTVTFLKNYQADAGKDVSNL